MLAQGGGREQLAHSSHDKGADILIIPRYGVITGQCYVAKPGEEVGSGICDQMHLILQMQDSYIRGHHSPLPV